LTFSTDFESGAAENPHQRWDGAVAFSIPHDPGGKEYLWFYFKVMGAPDQTLDFVIENAEEAHQTGDRWEITRPVFSADGVHWERAREAHYIREFSLQHPLGQKVFRFRSPIAAETLYVAYCYPYTPQMLHEFLASVKERSDGVSSLGKTEEGREIPVLQIGPKDLKYPENALEIWVICREHPGETPASYALEGMVEALLNHPAGKHLADRYRCIFVPMLNLDGAVRGYYYRNAAGVNLARDWVDFKAAETRALKAAMAPSFSEKKVKLVVNLHSSNDPSLGHFFLETPPSQLFFHHADLQRAILSAADQNHPQLQGRSPVRILDLPNITGNALLRDYDTYCLYLECNYSRGADGSLVTPQSLRETGRALVQALAETLDGE
jgi:murein tripeptide amidase MpaA